MGTMKYLIFVIQALKISKQMGDGSARKSHMVSPLAPVLLHRLLSLQELDVCDSGHIDRWPRLYALMRSVSFCRTCSFELPSEWPLLYEYKAVLKSQIYSPALKVAVREEAAQHALKSAANPMAHRQQQ